MNTENTILSQLNSSQQEAVKHIEGPLMLIAGAGSGKTRVLTHRIAYMLTKGISPYNILALTFTNKAAKEMRERVYDLIGEANAKATSVGTFHSIFLRILRIEATKLGFRENLTVYDTDDAKNVLKNIIKDMNLDIKTYLPGYVLSRISNAKSSLLSAEDYAQSPEIAQADTVSGLPMIGEIFLRYAARLRKSNAMDFDDLLYFMNVLLRDFPETLLKYQRRYRYILVDEYQDTNYAQYLIVKKLAALSRNICVVGDDAQSIYAFRGANIENILNFRRDYPEAKLVKLEQNYRSTKNIVKAANAIIKYNTEQLQKEVWTNNDEGAKITIHSLSNETEEANTVANSILDMKLNFHLKNNQFAILYRTNAQSRALEETLMKRNIPYKIYAATSFYNRKEIRDLIAYFRLTVNNYDEEALRRIINYPHRGIGATTLEKITVAADEYNVHLWNIVNEPHVYNPEVNSPTKTRLQDFASKIKSYTAQIQKMNAYDLAMHIVTTSGMLLALKENIAEKERLENVEEMLDSIKSFTEKQPDNLFNEETGEMIENYVPTLDRYLESVALLIDDVDEDKEDEDKVKLMTIHAAKGLEFDHVYVTGMEENLFPSSLSLATKRELEEERRLFYVAVTRAKESLTLTHCQMRYKYGSPMFCERSRFLDEIPDNYLKIIQKASSKASFSSSYASSNYGKSSYSVPLSVKKSVPKTSKQINTASIGKEATPDDIVPNIRVYHATFGYGNVIKTDGVSHDKKAVVNFDSVGEKTLLLKFAKLILPYK